MKKTICPAFIAFALALSACQPNQPPANLKKDNSQDDFVGCYSVEKGMPAQIQISQKNGYTMQMKEPDGGWDTPEALDLIELDKAWEAYAVNALNLEKSNIKATLARPDGVMMISRLGQGAAVNPHLDSMYIVNIFGATNTIYQVECDDVGLDLAKDGEHYHKNLSSDKSKNKD